MLASVISFAFGGGGGNQVSVVGLTERFKHGQIDILFTLFLHLFLAMNFFSNINSLSP